MAFSGTHVDGLSNGIWKYAKGKRARKTSIKDIRETFSWGLIAIVHVGLYHPRFGNPTKEHLVSPEAGTAVARTLASDLALDVERNGDLRDFLARRLGI